MQLEIQICKALWEAWLADYNEQLPHDALGDPTPVEYRVLHHPETYRNGWD